MMINGRLLLLIAATGLFIHVWSANDRANQWNRPRAVNSATVFTPSLPIVKTSAQTIACGPRPTAAMEGSASEESWTADSCPVPLPAAIQAGLYRVIDDTGRVARLELVSTGTQAKGSGTSRDADEFFVVTAGTRRWYFVRLQTPESQKLLANSPVIARDASKDVTTQGHPRSPCSNRKFDFTGYFTTKPAEDEWESYISLPDPSDLPGLR